MMLAATRTSTTGPRMTTGCTGAVLVSFCAYSTRPTHPAHPAHSSAVCRAVTEQTVGPFWVQARRVEPACSSRTAGLAPPRGAPPRPDNPHAVNRSSRSVGDVNRSRRGPRCAFLPYSFLPCLISTLVSLALPYLTTLPHLHRTLSSHPGSMSHSYGPTTVLGHTVEAYFNREYDVRKQ